MTAEIAILNKEAIAMAADSAVTFQDEDGQKIFTSANKIFTLSKYQPIGVMIYGEASFMGVPWETIIKSYRKQLGSSKSDTLKNAAQDFINFFCEKNTLFPKDEQERFVVDNILSYFDHIKKDILKEVEALYREGKKPKDQDIKEITSRTIKNHYDTWQKPESDHTVDQKYLEKLTTETKKIVSDGIKRIFEKLPLTKKLKELLHTIAVALFLKFPESVTRTNYSGIVIAGFGANEIFPSLISYRFDGIAYDRLKYRIENEHQIGSKSDAAIIPFAQSEMVVTFIAGINPEYQSAIIKDMFEILDEYPNVILDDIEQINTKEREKLKKRYKKISNEKFEEYIKGLEEYKREHFVDPILKIVAFLPKTELAAMAESLVNLTSFKRRVSPDAETVGGPIDVAVISKGDGFIWIKRKHYFKPELNTQFFENYYKEEEDRDESRK